jgi:5'-methylthioadenosine phosphorylase
VSQRASIAVILGSAFERPRLGGAALEPVPVATGHGEVTLHRFPRRDLDAWVLFRHGVPHRYLPSQIPFRAHAAALRSVGCGALLVTSSVGVLDRAVRLDEPLLLADLLMLENRLPDGTACTMFCGEPAPEQGHLVLDEGLFSRRLGEQVTDLGRALGWPMERRVLFAYVQGPRTKTAAENLLLRALGVQVNSMSIGPEVVLANELEIPTAGLVVGHKLSLPGETERLERDAMGRTLRAGGDALAGVTEAFLRGGEPVPFANHLHRFHQG